MIRCLKKVLLIGIACVSLAAFARANASVESPTGSLTGGWRSAVTAEFPETLDKESIHMLLTNADVDYEPVLYLASQVVAGTNHMVLCAKTPLTEEPAETSLVVVVLYQNLSGGVSLLSETKFEFISLVTGVTEVPAATDNPA